MLDLEWLCSEADYVRHLLDNLDRSGWGAQFAGFPRGACGATSHLFGVWLLDTHGLDSDYVSSRRKSDKFHSHAWLELDGIVVDLTCDQFHDCPLDGHFVGPITCWHQSWETDERITVKRLEETVHSNFIANCGQAYADIQKAMTIGRSL